MGLAALALGLGSAVGVVALGLGLGSAAGLDDRPKRRNLSKEDCLPTFAPEADAAGGALTGRPERACRAYG